MLFSSLTFIGLFLPVVLLGYFLLPSKARNYWLLAASLFFYTWGEPKFVLVMLLSIALNYVFALLIDRMRGKDRWQCFFLIAAILCNLVVMVAGKYLNIVLRNFNRVFGEVFEIRYRALPIGISFFTFQEMSYIIDVYRGKVKVQKNPFFLGLYVSFFPQLIAGPIVRYSTIEREIRERKVTMDGFASGISRFVLGLGKKILLANSLSVVADRAFLLNQGDAALSVSFAWLGIICYTLQIFFDFSGYSDMAIGLGKMFGFTFLENFNYPYISASISEFWRRWHISLGSWFRDYVYFPLGGSRVHSRVRLVFNLFVVWMLTGIWHGANWTFLLWGLMYFVLIAFEKLTGVTARLRTVSGKVLYRVATILFIMAGWVLFRADTVSAAVQYLRALAGANGNPLTDDNAVFYWREYVVLLPLSILCATPVFRAVKEKIAATRLARVTEWMDALWYTAVFLLCLSCLVMGGNNPFIYFNF